METMDAIIIGAGASGLMAAREMKTNGYNIKILEASERLGGRMRKDYLDDMPITLGATWFSNNDPRILKDIAGEGDVDFTTFAPLVPYEPRSFYHVTDSNTTSFVEYDPWVVISPAPSTIDAFAEVVADTVAFVSEDWIGTFHGLIVLGMTGLN